MYTSEESSQKTGRNKGHASFKYSSSKLRANGGLEYFQIFAVVLEKPLTTYVHVIESTLIHFSPSTG